LYYGEIFTLSSAVKQALRCQDQSLTLIKLFCRLRQLAHAPPLQHRFLPSPPRHAKFGAAGKESKFAFHPKYWIRG
jgi:hypothetical protein